MLGHIAAVAGRHTAPIGRDHASRLAVGASGHASDELFILTLLDRTMMYAGTRHMPMCQTATACQNEADQGKRGGARLDVAEAPGTDIVACRRNWMHTINAIRSITVHNTTWAESIGLPKPNRLHLQSSLGMVRRPRRFLPTWLVRPASQKVLLQIFHLLSAIASMELPTHQPLVEDSDEDLSDEQIRELLNEAAERMRAKAAQPAARTEAPFKLPKLASGRIADTYEKTQGNITRLDHSKLVDKNQAALANGIKKIEDPLQVKKQKQEVRSPPVAFARL